MTDSQYGGSTDTDADVLIVGGGLAGLAVANYLARFNDEPAIVEQRTEWDTSVLRRVWNELTKRTPLVELFLKRELRQTI